MEEKYPIDEHFGKKLQQHEVPAPEHVWSNIEKNIRKKKPIPWLFWLGGGMAVVALAVFGAYLFQAESQLDNNDLVSIGEQQMENPTALHSDDIAGVANGATSNGTDNLSRAIEKPSEATTKETNLGLTTNQAAFSPKPLSEPTAKAPRYRVKKAGGLGQTISRGGDEFFEKKGISKTGGGGENIEIEATNTIKIQKEIADAANLTLQNPKAFSLLSLKETPFLDKKQGFWAIDAKPKVAYFPITKKARSACFDFSEVGTVVAVETYAGMGYGLRTLTANGNPDQNTWRTSRLDSEQNRFAWIAGANAMFLTKTHLVLRAGVQLTQQKEQFELRDPLSVRTSIFIDTNFVTGQISTDTLTEVGYRHVRTQNRLTMVDIPVSVGYEFRKGRKGISVHAGGAVNAYFHRRGEIFDAQNHRMELGADDNYFKNRLGFSGTVSAQFFYTFTPSARIYVEPYAQHIFQPVSLSGQAVQQRYTFGGVRIGVAKAIH